MKATLYVSGLRWNAENPSVQNYQGSFLPFDSKRVYLHGFKSLVREIQLQYLGYKPSFLKAAVLAFRNQATLFVRNPKLAISEILYMHAFSFEIIPESDLPIKIEFGQENRNNWISRNGALNGVKTQNLSAEIEWNRIRKSKTYSAFIWDLHIDSEKFFTFNQIEAVSTRKKCNIRTGLQLFNNLTDGELNMRTLGPCDVYNGLFSVERHSVSYIDSSHFLDDFAWPTNLLFTDNGSFALIEIENLPEREIQKAILFGSSTSWFHFLVEILPRFLVNDIADLAEFDVIVRGEMPESIMEILGSLRIKSIISMCDGDRIRVNKLLTLTELRYRDVSDLAARQKDICLVREYILNLYPQILGPRFVYLERDENLFRKLRNRSDLRNLLLSLGFTVIKPELLNVADQVALFTNAEIVVSESGAALSNIIFMNFPCRVVEIHPGGSEAGLWASLGSIFGIEVSVVYGKPDRIRNLISGIGSYKIKISHVEKIIYALTH